MKKAKQARTTAVRIKSIYFVNKPVSSSFNAIPAPDSTTLGRDSAREDQGKVLRPTTPRHKEEQSESLE